MPKILPASVVLEKNKLESQNVWYFLVKLDAGDFSLYFTTNNEPVTYLGQVYDYFPMNIGNMDSNADGKVPGLTLSVSNVGKLLTFYMDTYEGFVDANITLMIVNSALLNEDYTELTLEYTIMSAEVSDEWVTFSLGGPNPLRQRFPAHIYVAKYCNWIFKSVECKYTGPDATCDRSLEDCKLKNNRANFGGFPGLDASGLRVIR